MSSVDAIADASASFQSIRQWDEVGQLDALVRLSRAVWRDRGYGDTWPYMLLAEGRLEFVAEFGVKEYDIAALVPIITEAGGRFTSFDGTDSISERSSLATNGVLHAAFLDLLHAARTFGVRTMTRTLSLLGAALVLTATLLATTACAGHRHGGTRLRGDARARGDLAHADARLRADRAAPAADPTCETIIPAATVEDFESVGWTARAEPFRVGELEIAEGVQCIWGDFTTATDHVQIFGWAPISEDDADEAQDALVAEGWTRRGDPRGTSSSPRAPRRPSRPTIEGYGLTYLFGDGWVKYADTKQGLLLVDLAG